MNFNDYDFYIFNNLCPEPWSIGTASTGRKDGNLTARISPDHQLKAYQNALRETIINPRMLTGDISLVFYFWRNLPEYTTESGRKHSRHIADVTNLQKATEDALQGIIFKNDNSVFEIYSVIVSQNSITESSVLVGASNRRSVLDIIMEFPRDKMRALKTTIEAQHLATVSSLSSRIRTETESQIQGQMSIEDIF